MNLSPLVTLIDPDPRGLATLAYSFEKERFTVTGTSELNRAKQLIGATGSRVALIALRSPEQAALETISELRSALATRTLPIVAFGPPALRNAAIAAGAFDYLDTPMLVRDASVVCRLWLYVRGPTSDRDTVPDMVGSLDLLHGLFFLMRAMGSTGRSGVLQLTRGNRKAEVKFTDGAVTSAELRGMQAFPALHQLLLWAGAELSLKLRHVPRRAQFSAKGAEILEECERFLRDVTHAARQLGSLQTVFAIDARQGGALQAGVPEEVAPVARFFDGSRTLGEVIEESPFRVFDTLRVVKRLIDSGVLMPRTATAPSTGSHPAAPAHGNPVGRAARAHAQRRPDSGGSQHAAARHGDPDCRAPWGASRAPQERAPDAGAVREASRQAGARADSAGDQEEPVGRFRGRRDPRGHEAPPDAAEAGRRAQARAIGRGEAGCGAAVARFGDPRVGAQRGSRAGASGRRRRPPRLR